MINDVMNQIRPTNASPECIATSSAASPRRMFTGIDIETVFLTARS
jgi:hypothetical protein